MLVDCPEMTEFRESCGLGPFISAYRRMNPHISSIKIFALYLNDNHSDKMKKKSLDLFHMKLGWHSRMNINL